MSTLSVQDHGVAHHEEGPLRDVLLRDRELIMLT